MTKPGRAALVALLAVLTLCSSPQRRGQDVGMLAARVSRLAGERWTELSPAKARESWEVFPTASEPSGGLETISEEFERGWGWKSRLAGGSPGAKCQERLS